MAVNRAEHPLLAVRLAVANELGNGVHHLVKVLLA
jgi:hypothetical protein